jgi:hypothetical protein
MTPKRRKTLGFFWRKRSIVAIIHQKDKRSGITYAYESISYWDREKQRSRSKRRLIGRIDEQTGNIVPTRGTNRRGPQETVSAPRPGPVPHVDVAQERLSARRLLVSSEQALDGKLFVQLLALIYLSYMKKLMKEQQLFGTYTIQGVLDQLDALNASSVQVAIFESVKLLKNNANYF